MWKPGTDPPVSAKKSNKKKKQRQNDEESPLQGSGSILSSSKNDSKTSTTPKRLSGATMNMRFMKRKQETAEQEKERKRMSLERTQASLTEDTTASTVPASQSEHRSAPDHGNDDDGDDMVMDETTMATSSEGYQVATSIDMYGIQAAIIGRRSFGGFNPAMEEAWKGSKASLGLDSSTTNKRSKKPQESDEELIRRYQEIAKKRSESSRVVGNLGDKSKPKRQRR